mmetsp:Transcript_25599/g.65806  ORF Transcript_25599/g.65806 Transcript_25599/m.65806 type:complete len:83 (-) Transcript_25599:85-333(-)
MVGGGCDRLGQSICGSSCENIGAEAWSSPLHATSISHGGGTCAMIVRLSLRSGLWIALVSQRSQLFASLGLCLIDLLVLKAR